MEKKIECIVVGPIETNCWLYAPGPVGTGARPCFVIDPGDRVDLIIARLKELNLVPEYIFATHGHYDHITALPELLKAVKSGIFGPAEPKVGIHKGDVHHLKGVKPDILFDEGDVFGPLKVMHIPGHTQGCVAFFDEEAGALFTGDTMFKGDYGRTDLPGGNEEQIFESLKQLLSMNEDIIVLPGHGPPSTIREEILSNPELSPRGAPK
ncbi:MAG: MBL fold metallo-hydrolase [Treponema sp.]|nr:MBL fold metallo-hydrolase [Treponema sp.]